MKSISRPYLLTIFDLLSGSLKDDTISRFGKQRYVFDKT